MTRLLLILMLDAQFVAAQDAFKAPQRYDAKRYEADWARNPFTLQTAPVAAPDNPFAKDLAVASCYGDKADPTVVVVNTKTHQRYTLRKGKDSEQGWRLGEVQLGASRQNITAEIWMGNERAVLSYDTEYVRALASSSAASAAPAKRPPGIPGAPVVPGAIPMPRQPQDGRIPAPVPATTGVSGPRTVPNATGAPMAPVMAGAPVAPVSNQLSNSNAATAPNGTASSPQISDANSISVPRRRIAPMPPIMPSAPGR